VKVCDFGLSCAKEKFDPKGPLKDKAVGTPVYMVPPPALFSVACLRCIPRSVETARVRRLTTVLHEQAPEILCGIPASEKSDVYAYGMLLWELFARQGKPFAHMNSFQLFCETVVGT
jgi:serine/threonine protein kinase